MEVKYKGYKTAKKKKGKPISKVLVNVEKTGKTYLGKLYKRNDGSYVVNVIKTVEVVKHGKKKKKK